MAFRESLRHFRREQIIGATLRSLAEIGCDALQMRDVAQALTISRATLYAEFDSKAALIDASLASVAEALSERVQAELDAQPNSDGLLAAVDLLLQAAADGQIGDPILPCCLRQIRCPWSHWGRLESLLLEPLRLLSADRPDNDPVEPGFALALLRILSCSSALVSAGHLSHAQLRRTFRAALGLHSG